MFILPLANYDNQGDYTDHDDDDEDNRKELSYGRRSAAWTNRYRRLIPYDLARKRAMSLGLRSKQEWDDYIQDEVLEHGPYLPTRPDEMYPDDFEGWEEFLGCMRPYDETRQIVQSVLGLKCMDEYLNFVRDDAKRAEGLRIPAIPEIVYKDSGWIDDKHFFSGLD